jgi:CDP-diacylglycerol--serine O-phosphatidyltransferase
MFAYSNKSNHLNNNKVLKPEFLNIKKHIPNIITLCNLLSGVLGIHFFFADQLLWSIYCIFLSGILDFFDGFAARLLKVESPIGKDLDSLADVVSFGVLPGFLMFQMVTHASTILQLPEYIEFLAFLIPVFSALRLARFNHDTSQSVDFKGLATPANAFYIASLSMVHLQENVDSLFSWIALLSMLIIPILLNLPVRLFSMKIKDKSLNSNWDRVLFVVLSTASALIFQWKSGPIILSLYFVLSIFVTNKIRPL